MNFTKKTVEENGTFVTKYYINNKEVSFKTYRSMMEEEGEKPSLENELLEKILNAESKELQLSILKEFIVQFEAFIAYNACYSTFSHIKNLMSEVLLDLERIGKNE